MKFCEYGSQKSIIKLKEKDELKKMLIYVIANNELFEDEQERMKMFGRFKFSPVLMDCNSSESLSHDV